jgi:uncharacterized damage-inducible protein DinB
MVTDDLGLLAEQSRKRTIKKLKDIPEGLENWRLNRTTPSFAEITRHLIEIDEMFLALPESGCFIWKKGDINPEKEYTTQEFKEMFKNLSEMGKKRKKRILSMSEEDLQVTVENGDKKKLTMQWFILKHLIQHETYHSGQLSANVKMFREEFTV